LRVTEEEYERIKNRPTHKIANVESVARNEPLAKKACPRFDKICNIHVHHKSNRSADPDGRSLKAAIDGLVETGILAGDSTKFIKKVTQSQEVVRGIEETIITITEAE
jgi:hypothetical protein